VPHVFERTRPGGQVLEVRGAPLPQGGFVTVYTDITARRVAENELLTRTAYLSEVIACIPQGISVFDAELRLKYWNDEFVRVLELPRDAVYRDVAFADLIRIPARRGEYGPGDPEMHVRNRVELARQFKAHRFERTRPSGKTHLVNGTPLTINGKVAGFITTYTDITDRKEAEASIHKLLGVQRAILDGAEHSIIAIDRDGLIIEFNHGAELMLGYSADEVVGRMRPWQFHVDAEIERRAHELSAELGEVVEPGFRTFTVKADRGQRDSHEWTYVRRDGSRLSVLLSITPIRDAGGATIGYLGVGSDITQWREAEAEVRRLNESLEARVVERTEELARANQELRQAMDRLVQSEKMVALGRLVAGVAHELNTPLGTTLTVASAAAHRVADFRNVLASGAVRKSVLDEFVGGMGEAMKLIERNSDRAARLMHDFKEIASDQASSRRRKYSLAKVIEELLSTLGPRLSRASVRVVSDIEAGLELDGYPGPLEQIVQNLCINAIMHGFEDGSGGTLSIAARSVDADRVELAIADDGVGMPEDVIRQAFDPFFTTKLGRGGTGLGLYIVYTQVTGILGGDVTIQSAPDRGTRFVITLPKVAPRRHETAGEART
jgi:PAS domain S-box-containing protein